MVKALIALIYNKFECLKYLIYRPSLIYEGLIGKRLLYRRLRKYLSLKSDTWKIICQFLIMLSYHYFLSKFHDVLHGSSSIRLNYFVFLSTNTWRGHLLSLGQSQNSMVFDSCLFKNKWKSLETAIDCCWYE